MRPYSATSDFITAMCMWTASTRVSITRAGFTIREAPCILGQTRRFVCGRLTA